MPKRGAGVPARGLLGLGRLRGWVFGRGGSGQVTGLIDIFPGRRCGGDAVRAEPLVGWVTNVERLERLETASALQSIGGLDRWRVSDAGFWQSITGWQALPARRGKGRGAGQCVGAPLGAMGVPGKAHGRSR